MMKISGTRSIGCTVGKMSGFLLAACVRSQDSFSGVQMISWSKVRFVRFSPNSSGRRDTPRVSTALHGIIHLFCT